MFPGHSEADCVRACVRAGSMYAIVAGDRVHLLKGNQQEIESLAGKGVVVTGHITKTSMTVQSVSEQQ
jgi:hydroxyethylthiazole kinase-like sugar kinase family protein